MTKIQIAILWGLALLVVIVFAALSHAISQPPPARSPEPTLPAVDFSLPLTKHSARSLYPLAEQAAQEWQQDARLVSAATSWPFVHLDDFSEPTDWTFQFFSPGTQRLYVVNVNDAQVTPIREMLSPYPLPTIAVDRWQVDSHQALNAWLNGGGGSFLRLHPVIDVSTRLRQSEDGRPVWSVVGMVGGSQATHIAKVDAVDGALLP